MWRLQLRRKQNGTRSESNADVSGGMCLSVGSTDGIAEPEPGTMQLLAVWLTEGTGHHWPFSSGRVSDREAPVAPWYQALVASEPGSAATSGLVAITI